MRVRPAVALAAAVVALSACSHDGRAMRDPSPEQTASILVPTTTTGPAFDTTPGLGPLISLPWDDGGPIPIEFTCRGQDFSPAIGWAGLPPESIEVAIAITDPDAGEFVHWVVTGLDPAVGQVAQDGVPEEAAQARNDFGTPGYRGPCPAEGTHTYVVTLYALGEPSGMIDGSDPREAIARLQQLQLSGAIATGTFAAP